MTNKLKTGPMNSFDEVTMGDLVDGDIWKMHGFYQTVTSDQGISEFYVTGSLEAPSVDLSTEENHYAIFSMGTDIGSE